MLYAHMRIAAHNSGDSGLISILSLKDMHSLMTSKIMKMVGKDFSQEYCQANKKDPLIDYYRSVAKAATYIQFNDGSAPVFHASLMKSYVDVTLEACELAKEALGEAFPGYAAYAIKLKAAGNKHIKHLPEGHYVQYRTHDGRLFHVQAHERTNYKGESYFGFKLGEITSSMLISPEANAMKKSGIEILDFMRANRDLPIKLNSFTHD